VSEPPRQSPGGQRPEQPQNIATAIADISERATLLVHEEIELAKAEVTEKVTKLARGAVVGVAAGVFFVMALIFALVGCAWLLYYYLPGNNFTYFWGFFAMAVILLLLGALAGLIAAKVVKKSAPPVPTMAIEEARLIRETVGAGADSFSATSTPGATAGAPAPSATAAPLLPPVAAPPPPAATAPPVPPPAADPPAPADSPPPADPPVADGPEEQA
jgi:Putative Actinobacterial Holin-X, holin superfamily III